MRDDDGDWEPVRCSALVKIIGAIIGWLIVGTILWLFNLI